MSKLTEKQKVLFNSLTSSLRKQVALEYIKLNYDNGTKAYLNACKKLKKKPSKNPVTSASEILNYPNVTAFIDSVRVKVAEKVQVLYPRSLQTRRPASFRSLHKVAGLPSSV